MPELEHTYKRIAFLVAAACVLQVVESFFPHPFPGLRLGLANVITLLALFDLGFAVALQIAVLRTVVASLLLGTFLSPTFMLSFAGAVISITLLGLLHRLTVAKGRVVFSFIGFSVLGAVSHNLTQLVVIYFFLGRNSGTWLLSPWLILTGVGTGLLTGIVAARAFVLVKTTGLIAKPADAAKVHQETAPAPAASVGSQNMATVKLLLAISFIVAVAILNWPFFYLTALVILLLLYAVAKIPLQTLMQCLKRVTFLLVFSFVITALFAPGTALERIFAGSLFSTKIVLIILSTTLVTKTTAAPALAAAIAAVLWPLRLFRLSPDRLAQIIIAAMEAVSRFWRIFYDFRQVRACDGRKFREIVPWLASLLAFFYQEAALVENNAE